MVGAKTKKIDLGGFFGAFGKSAAEAQTEKLAEVEMVKISEFRFAENEYLLRDLEKCLQIFSVENASACRVARYIVKDENKRKETGKDLICFCYPTSVAYVSALKLADGVLMNEAGEISNESLDILTDGFIESHLLSNQLSDWMQEKDAPLWSIKILHNGEQLDVQIGNAVQVAIIAAVWAAINPECHHEIKKA